jgi:hypothetical protein
MLQGLAGAAALAAGVRPVQAAPARIGPIIAAAARLPTVAQRIGVISRALRGSRYVSYSLVGGPDSPERFVTRDDGFDCVTFCETVLAAARARAPEDFAARLREIRYAGGVVDWHARNHYFYEWSENNVANGILRPVVLPGSFVLEKTLSQMRSLGARPMSLIASPSASLTAHPERLSSGDIIGFLSQRPTLDYFHTGFVFVDVHRGLWLRHAARSRGRVLDEPLPRFLAINRVQAVTLLRAEEGRAVDVVV